MKPNETDPGITPAAETQVADWLRALDLERYASAFEAQRIDMRSLPLLGENDLTELGVPLGHRKLLQKAIAELSAARLPASTTALEAQGLIPAQAERRQITVMFCELIDSTAMANRLDPEALRELMHAYQQACGTAIEKYDGHVAQYLGDGLMAYFGWPLAHEDDAERAVHAAREVVAAVKRAAAAEPRVPTSHVAPAPQRLDASRAVCAGRNRFRTRPLMNRESKWATPCQVVKEWIQNCTSQAAPWALFLASSPSSPRAREASVAQLLGDSDAEGRVLVGVREYVFVSQRQSYRADRRPKRC